MIRYAFVLIFLLFLDAELTAQSYGLAFNSHNVVQEQRTSLDLSPGESLCFDKNVQLEFDLNFKANQTVYFGYILRLLNGSQNIDLICSQNTFKVVVGQKLAGIEFIIDTATLYNKWSRIKLLLDIEHQQLQVNVNGKKAGEKPVRFSGNCFNFLWGANDDPRFNTRDLPPMRIRDIKLIEQNKERYHWSLEDTSGEWSKDLIAKKMAHVNNPLWIRPRHLHWELAASFTVAGNAGVAFDKKNERLFIAGSDSLWTFRAGVSGNQLQKTDNPYENLLLGNQAIYDTLTNRLYDIFIDQQKIVAYNGATAKWEGGFRDSLLTEFWHANKFISPADSSLYIIAGYGQLKYKNLVQRYQFGSGKWEILPTGGDFFTPRYLSALGTNKTGDTAYIVGGYGSPKGDQMLNPGYYFDMYRFDVRNRSFHRMFSLDSLQGPYVFANSLVMDPDNSIYYGLIFRNGSFDTQLQLVKGSLKDSSLQYTATPIPYSFHDIQSFADLYYSSQSKKLIAVTLFYSKEEDKIKKTAVKVYTIDFPPEPALFSADSVSKTADGPASWWWLVAVTGLLVLIIAGRIYVKKKKQQPADPDPAPAKEKADVLTYQHTLELEENFIRPAIHLFGHFQVTAQEGEDITKAFPPLLKELFLLILIYTVRNKKGISSEAMDEILWHNKAHKDAKNNRSVNLVKLKTILGKLGEVSVIKEAGYWQFKTSDDSISVDYQEFMWLTNNSPVVNKAYMVKLLQLLERGAFLQQTEYTWLDDIKSEVSNKVIDSCLTYIESVNLADEAEFIIAVTNTMFHFDRLSEDALRYKCKCLIFLKRHALASDIFLKFTKEYKEVYGEEFSLSFNEIIK